MCLYYLHELGDLVYFNEGHLCTKIILDHNWLTIGLYYILNDNHIKENKGAFTRQQAYTTWANNKYNDEEKEMLISLLLKDRYDICYLLPNKPDSFIAPLLLPNDKPNKWEYETNLHFRHDYSFMPHGMFSRLIVRLQKYIDDEQHWETGVRLVLDEKGKTANAEIQYVSKENKRIIDIKINGDKDSSKELLSIIRYEIKYLQKDFENINVKEYVACNCATCLVLIKEGKQPNFYRYSMLMDKVKNHSYFVECHNLKYAKVNIGLLLSDIVLEDAGQNNVDNTFLHQLKEMGMSVNQIINNNQNVNTQNQNVAQTQTTTVKVDIKIVNEIKGGIETLREDLEDKRELLLKKLNEDDLDDALIDVKNSEKAITEIVEAGKNSEEPTPKSKSRLKRFMNDLADEESSIYKTLKVLRKGRDYGVSIAEAYNKVAENIGMPSVPPIGLEVIKKL